MYLVFKHICKKYLVFKYILSMYLVLIQKSIQCPALITFHPHYKNFWKVYKLWQTIINRIYSNLLTENE